MMIDSQRHFNKKFVTAAFRHYQTPAETTAYLDFPNKKLLRATTTSTNIAGKVGLAF